MNPYFEQKILSVDPIELIRLEIRLERGNDQPSIPACEQKRGPTRIISDRGDDTITGCKG